jgi:nucleoside-diphosphate-sugar epimerase
MRILICGHTSFASQGLPRLLRAAGHSVTCFGRGAAPDSRQDPEYGTVVTSPVTGLHENPLLRPDATGGRFDAVVNYILLKDDDIARNVAYTQSLLSFCRATGVPHLVHISSVSSYNGKLKLITEDATLEQDPLSKGAYGSLKVASDNDILAHRPPATRLTMIRPGFILGSGLVDPIVGTGARLPWNRLLVIGTGESTFPVIERRTVNEAVRRVIESPGKDDVESILLVADNSPTRREYMAGVAKELGAGTGGTTFPSIVWWSLAIGGEAVARLIGQAKLKPFSKLASRLRRQRFDARRSQERLGLKFDADWRTGLRESLGGQSRNFELPYDPQAVEGALAARRPPQRVAFLGYGRIVKQKHLPALRRLGFGGQIDAYDLLARTDADTDQAVRAIGGGAMDAADLYVVASPGPAHVDAISRIPEPRGAVLVEKPLGYNEAELARWQAFAGGRAGPVMVCHNYRYKDNVAAMLRLLSNVNPGRLLHAHVDFSSPPASHDSVPWLRNERRARTLLLDYALHFLDLACMFSVPGQPWELADVRHELNPLGQTAVIQGTARSQYSASFLLRQGFAPRRCRILFTFQNYSASLGFFPDTFVPHVSNDNAWLYKQESKASGRATRRKILDKLTGRDADPSHARVLAAATAGDAALAAPLAVGRLTPFYNLLFAIDRAVYGS